MRDNFDCDMFDLDPDSIARKGRRVLLVSPYYSEQGGGVERVTQRMAQGLVACGWHVTWVASSFTDCAEVPLANEAGCIRVPAPAWNAVEKRTGVPFPLWGIRAIRRLWAATGTADAVVVHESLYVPSMLACLVARWRGRPLMVVQHVGLVPYRNPLVRGLMQAGNQTWSRSTHFLATKTVFISQAVRRYFEGPLPNSRSTLIPNGVDITCFAPREAFAPVESRRPRVLFVGRFVEKKGLDIVRALAQLRSDVDFLLAGKGPLRPENWQLANVQVLGHIDAEQLACAYRDADLLLLPSHGEGFPLVVQEAMATGLAPLVSHETAEALPGVAAHVYSAPVLRGMPDLIEKWSTLIDEALAAERDATAALARVAFVRTHWSWERCIQSYDALLQELTAREF